MISNKEIKKHLDSLDRRMDLMDRSLLLHNPDSPRAAEMFDGLRKRVRASFNATQALQVGLAQLDQIAESTDDVEDIRVKLKELMDAAALRKVRDVGAYGEAFDVLGSGPVEAVARPAYVADTAGGAMVVVRGVVEYSDAPEPSSEPPEDSSKADEAEDSSSASGQETNEASHPKDDDDEEGTSE